LIVDSRPSRNFVQFVSTRYDRSSFATNRWEVFIYVQFTSIILSQNWNFGTNSILSMAI